MITITILMHWKLGDWKVSMIGGKHCASDLSENSVINNMFPLSYVQATVTTRKPEKFHVNMASTGRYKKSAMPFMQRLLNSDSEI